jgi:hypothetical protein
MLAAVLTDTTSGSPSRLCAFASELRSPGSHDVRTRADAHQVTVVDNREVLDLLFENPLQGIHHRVAGGYGHDVMGRHCPR